VEWKFFERAKNKKSTKKSTHFLRHNFSSVGNGNTLN
jgi:hypothetical protein